MSRPVAGSPKLCVIGTGALGSALLEQLRAHRYEPVLLVDPDFIEERNLPLSPLLRRARQYPAQPARPGRAPREQRKAELLACAARDLDGLNWTADTCEAADFAWQFLHDVDLVCSCTDSVLSRVEVAWIARMLQRPVLDGGVFGDGIAEGRVTRFPAERGTACYLCGLTEERRAEVLGDASSASLGCRVREGQAPMTGTIETLRAVAQDMFREILRWPWQGTARASALRVRPAPDGEDSGNLDAAETVSLVRSQSCPWHDGLPDALYPLPWDSPLRETLPPGRELVLDWPICTEAVCGQCGARSTPMQRVARVRRTPCAVCGVASLETLRTVQRIRKDDPWSAFSPRQLGRPERHLYWLPNATGET